MKYTIREVAAALRPLNDHLPLPDAIVSQLLTDSRSLTYPQETIFFALRTANADGHLYINTLYRQGVRNFVVDAPDTLPQGLDRMANVLVVNNTLDALQTLAADHRRRFNIPVIGITGSRGKTTVKEWLYELLRDDMRIVRSPRSYNSQIGVPLSVWDIDEATELAIIEAGISTTGEMPRLQAIIRPTIGIITNLGSEHDEGFHSIAEKAQQKAEILTSCESVVYPADNALVAHTIAPLLEADVVQAIGWSLHDNPDANLLISATTVPDNDATTVTYRLRNQPDDKQANTFRVPFTNERDLDNVYTCLATLLLLNVDAHTIARRMARLTPIGTRINVVEGVNNCTLIIDGYTSDFFSLTPALNFMMRRAGSQQGTAILSDLSTETYANDELYIRVSELLKSKGVARLLGVGPDFCRFSHYFTDLPCARFFPDTDALLKAISQGDFEDETILIKAAPTFNFSQVVDLLEVRQHQTVEEINLEALAHNFKYYRSLLRADTKTVAMVKADGYGTGSYEVAKTLQDRGADYLAVAVQDEGVQLRKAGITMPIIVLNPSVVNYKAMFTYRLEPEVYSLEECRQLIAEGTKYHAIDFPVHIKLDTGMHRLGFIADELPALADILNHTRVLRPVSVFSHLCVADEPEQDDFTRRQIAEFTTGADRLEQALGRPLLRHLLNTAGVMRFPEAQFSMVRIGIGLYGISPTPPDATQSLQPVAALRSVIIRIEQWPAGTTIGYGRRGVLQRPSRIATVAIGYADGFDRHFGNGRTAMWVHGTMCPTIGNVCMDAVMIDVTDAPDTRVGDRVEIFGPHIPIERLAQARDTIPYEILTGISPRVKRVYYRD